VPLARGFERRSRPERRNFIGTLKAPSARARGPGQQSLQGPNEVAAFGAKTPPKAAAILGRFLRHADRFLTSQTAQRDAAAGTTISAGAATTSVHPESARSARKHTQGPPADGNREAVITSVGAQNRQISS